MEGGPGGAARGVAGGHNESYPNRRSKSGTGPREARRFPLAPDNFVLCPPAASVPGPVRGFRLITPVVPSRGLLDAARVARGKEVATALSSLSGHYEK